MIVLVDPPGSRLNLGGSGFSEERIRSLGEKTLGNAPEEAGKELAEMYAFPQQYEMSTPFHLMFMTCRSSEAQSSMILMQASPDQMVYVAGEYPPEQSLAVLNRRALHRHNFYELLYVIEGDIYQNIEHHRHYYPAGCCCLMNPNVYHTEESYDNQRVVFLGLRKDFLDELVGSARYFEKENSEAFRKLCEFLDLERGSEAFSEKASMDFVPLESEEWVRAHMHDVMEQILKIIQEPETGSSLRVRALILKMLCLLFDPAHYRPSPIRFASSQEEKLFEELTACIRAHHGRISRQALSGRFHYSGDYLYKTVRKFTGLSLSDYAAKICLDEAAERLRDSSVPVTELIRELGFTNQTQFYRKFRETYGLSPKDYRRSAVQRPEDVNA